MNQSFTYCVTGMLSSGLGDIPVSAELRVSYLDGGAFATGKPRPGEQFEICGFPLGAYDLWIATNNGDRVAGFIDKTFTIANRDIALGELYLEPPGQLRGKVILADATGDSLVPVISLDVRSIHRPRLHFAFEGEFGVSNGKGEFLIPDLFAD